MDWLLQNPWEVLGRLDALIGVVGVLIAAIFSVRTFLQTTHLIQANRRSAERRAAPIQIILCCPEADGKPEIELPYRPRRDQLSRAELQGLMGTYYGPERFDARLLLPILNDGTLDRVLAGTDESGADEVLRINCPQDTFEKFKIGITSSQTS